MRPASIVTPGTWMAFAPTSTVVSAAAPAFPVLTVYTPSYTDSTVPIPRPLLALLV